MPIWLKMYLHSLQRAVQRHLHIFFGVGKHTLSTKHLNMELRYQQMIHGFVGRIKGAVLSKQPTEVPITVHCSTCNVANVTVTIPDDQLGELTVVTNHILFHNPSWKLGKDSS